MGQKLRVWLVSFSPRTAKLGEREERSISWTMLLCSAPPPSSFETPPPQQCGVGHLYASSKTHDFGRSQDTDDDMGERPLTDNDMNNNKPVTEELPSLLAKPNNYHCKTDWTACFHPDKRTNVQRSQNSLHWQTGHRIFLRRSLRTKKPKEYIIQIVWNYHFRRVAKEQFLQLPQNRFSSGYGAAGAF